MVDKSKQRLADAEKAEKEAAENQNKLVAELAAKTQRLKRMEALEEVILEPVNILRNDINTTYKMIGDAKMDIKRIKNEAADIDKQILSMRNALQEHANSGTCSLIGGNDQLFLLFSVIFYTFSLCCFMPLILKDKRFF